MADLRSSRPTTPRKVDSYPYPFTSFTEQARKTALADLAMTLRFDNLPPLTIPTLNSASSTRSRGGSFSSCGSERSHETEATELAFSPTSSFSSSRPTSQDLTPRVQIPSLPCKPAIKVILGTASLGSSLSQMAKINTEEDALNFVDSFRSRGYLDIDTARAYPVGRGGTCEALLGSSSLRLKNWSNTSTKVQSFMPGSHRRKNIEKSINKSLEALDTDCVDIMYLHAPDRATSFVETCAAMNDAYNEGKFERFGLSNYAVAEVEEIVEICESNGFVKPTVYQGQYNPICRGAEDDLFTVLRKHGIAFNAYSPSACGFFSGKVSRASKTKKGSRWNCKSPLGAKYAGDYFHDSLFNAAQVVIDSAAKYGISGHAAALRWTVWHSDLRAEEGDGCIIGASSLQQLEENLDIMEQGPLPQGLIDVMDGVWDDVRYLGKGPRFSMTS